MIELIEELINIMTSLLNVIKKQNEVIEQNKIVWSLSDQEKNTI